MLNKYFSLIGLAGLLVFGACEEKTDPSVVTDVEVRFHAKYDGQDMPRSTNLVYENGVPINFEILTLYISDVFLLKGTEKVKLIDVEYLDFTPTSSSGTATVVPSFTYRDIPDGEYTGIQIGFGLRRDLNDKLPSDFAAGHPLARENEYWLGWDSYIFAKIQGKADADKNGSLETGVIYHCGADPTYTQATFTQAITISDSRKSLDVNIDFKKIFRQTNGTMFDIMANPITHSDPNNLTIATTIMQGFPRGTEIVQ